MRLFIAEKPSLGRAIAQFLPAQGAARGGAGGPPTHIVAGQDVVTWCFGHLLEMAEPEQYSPALKSWSFDQLPIMPDEWRLFPKEEATGQIEAIRSLLAEADEVVNAGDPDREGQLLVDELLEYLGNDKPVKRIWLAALDESSVRKALGDLRDNGDYQNLKASAEARQRGDWLVGMNLTRAYTLAGRRSGYDGVLSVGRVQTPTLALVVNRDLAIENFVPKDFYAVTATIKAAGGDFVARWKASDQVKVDEAGRVLDQAIAAAVVAKVSGQAGSVTKYEAAERKESAPLPYSLSALQLAASKKLGLGAQQVLDIAQELYEAKLTTYPRTDCRHLPESQQAAAPGILETLKRRGFIAEKGKQIISTAAGRTLIQALPEAVKSPGLTGLFEQVLDGIAEGRVSPAQFLAKQGEFVGKYVEVAKGADLGLAPAHPCPVCKTGYLRKRQKDGETFWGCSRYGEGCKTSFPDKAGEPDLKKKRAKRRKE